MIMLGPIFSLQPQLFDVSSSPTQQKFYSTIFEDNFFDELKGITSEPNCKNRQTRILSIGLGSGELHFASLLFHPCITITSFEANRDNYIASMDHFGMKNFICPNNSTTMNCRSFILNEKFLESSLSQQLLSHSYDYLYLNLENLSRMKSESPSKYHHILDQSIKRTLQFLNPDEGSAIILVPNEIVKDVISLYYSEKDWKNDIDDKAHVVTFAASASHVLLLISNKRFVDKSDYYHPCSNHEAFVSRLREFGLKHGYTNQMIYGLIYSLRC